MVAGRTTHAIVECGELCIPIASGAIDKGAIKGSLVDLCKNAASVRKSVEEITLFKSVGTAVEDLAAAILALKFE